MCIIVSNYNAVVDVCPVTSLTARNMENYNKRKRGVTAVITHNIRDVASKQGREVNVR